MNTVMIVEQTAAYTKRMKYDPITKSFSATEYDSLFAVRGVSYPYGWIKDSGTPPEPHLDIILISDQDFALGDEVLVRVVGVFLRSDGDNKLVALPPERPEHTLEELPVQERNMLLRLYPGKYEGDSWSGLDAAKAVIAKGPHRG